MVVVLCDTGLDARDEVGDGASAARPLAEEEGEVVGDVAGTPAAIPLSLDRCSKAPKLARSARTPLGGASTTDSRPSTDPPGARSRPLGHV